MQVFMICRVHNPFGICGEKKKKKQARKKEITGANTEKTTT